MLHDPSHPGSSQGSMGVCVRVCVWVVASELRTGLGTCRVHPGNGLNTVTMPIPLA